MARLIGRLTVVLVAGVLVVRDVVGVAVLLVVAHLVLKLSRDVRRPWLVRRTPP